MRFIVKYLKEHIWNILLWLSFVLIFAVVFYLYHLPLMAVVYPCMLCALVGFLYSCISVYKAYQRHKRLGELSSLSGAVMMEELLQGETMQEQDYYNIIRNLCGEMKQMEEKMTGSYVDMMDYYTVWVHQIKTPIASMRLHLGAEDSELSRRLSSELVRIEQYVEMVLTYLRMGTDYVFRPVNLDSILKENIRKFRSDFIIKKIRLQYEPSGEKIVTDEKWLSFVVGQILSNALKYTKEGTVTISLEPEKVLSISDTGIGIAAEDIPRIFEKGFTGYNGRCDKRASGLELYLSKEICNRLGYDISVTSREGKGTTFYINLNHSNFAHRFSLCTLKIQYLAVI